MVVVIVGLEECWWRSQRSFGDDAEHRGSRRQDSRNDGGGLVFGLGASLAPVGLLLHQLLFYVGKYRRLYFSIMRVPILNFG